MEDSLFETLFKVQLWGAKLHYNGNTGVRKQLCHYWAMTG